MRQWWHQCTSRRTLHLCIRRIKTKKKKINHSATAVGLHSPLTPMMIQYCWHQTLYEDVKVYLSFSVIRCFIVFQICTFSFYLHFRRHGSRACHFSLTTVFGDQMTSPLLDLCWISPKLQLLGFILHILRQIPTNSKIWWLHLSSVFVFYMFFFFFSFVSRVNKGVVYSWIWLFFASLCYL